MAFWNAEIFGATTSVYTIPPTTVQGITHAPGQVELLIRNISGVSLGIAGVSLGIAGCFLLDTTIQIFPMSGTLYLATGGATAVVSAMALHSARIASTGN